VTPQSDRLSPSFSPQSRRHLAKPGHSHSNGNGQAAAAPISLPAPVVDDNGEEFDLGHLLAVVKRRALTFLGVTSLTALGLAGWHMTRPPAYRGGFELLVEPVTVVNKLDLGTIPFAAEAEQSGLDYNSQIRVLRSPTVLEPIVAKIQQRYPQITYETLLGRLSIQRQSDSKVLDISYGGTDPEEIEFVLDELALGFIEYSVADRQSDLRRGIEFLDQQLDEKWQEVDTIESTMSDFQKQHDLVDVTAVSASVTERMNAMLAKQEALQVELASLQTLYRNLEQQVGYSTDAAIRIANLSESPQYQALLQDYRQVEQQLALELARFQADTPMIQALEDQRLQLLPLLQAEAERVLGSTLLGSADPEPAAEATPGRSAQDSADPEPAAEAATGISSLDPQDLGFKGQVSQGLVQQLVDTMNQIQVLQTQNAAITRVTEVLQGEIQYLADLGRSFKQIERELGVAENSFNQLLATRQELRFQMARQNAPWELISPLNAANIAPQGNLPRKLILSGVVGLLLGAAAALAKDKLDQGFHRTEDILAATKLPALATIPYVKSLEQRALVMNTALVSTMADLVSQQPVLVNQDTPSAFVFAESFYSLHTNLRLLGADRPVQVVTVTSARPGEGKSTVCAHLAIAATNMGQRVLIIDADMRRPTQHIIFGLNNRTGLSNYISGTSQTLGNIVQSIPGNRSLQVLSAGLQPPAPGGLLSSRRMHQLVDNLRHDYDMVIIDTPPLAGITDAKLTSTHADGMLLVTKMGSTPRSNVMDALTELSHTVQAPLLGLVINSVTSSGGNAYYNSSYYTQHSSRVSVSP
jgi:succinoglycan biosynthesis transport protein ExoP